jgi:hypothetical protein
MMIDFQTHSLTMSLASPEDRALLGSNPSAAAGDGNNSRSGGPANAPAPKHALFTVVLVRKAINPSPLPVIQLKLKLLSLTRPVCHLATSDGATNLLSLPTINILLLRSTDPGVAPDFLCKAEHSRAGD